MAARKTREIVSQHAVTWMTAAPEGYAEFLHNLADRVRAAQLRAAVAVNRELVCLYWQTGRDILARQSKRGWGAKVIDRLAADLRRELPGVRGFSPRNLKYMRRCAAAWSDGEFVQQVAAQLPWFHNCVVLDKIKDAATREWYLREAAAHGWSRSILVHQIESRLHGRQGQAINNFDRTLPASHAERARQLVKDPYTFDFLALAGDAHEREVEHGLLVHIRRFLLELGVGFAFVGSQVPLDVRGREYRLDLLFYHLGLRCFVVIDLKTGDFEPAAAGQMNFYLVAVDEQMRHADDQPTIGIILCKSRDRVIAEYALRRIQAPIGVWSSRAGQSCSQRVMRHVAREQHGWTYGTHSGFSFRAVPELGTFAASAEVATPKTDSALVAMMADIAALRGSRPATDSEVAFARRAATTRLALQFASLDQIASAEADLLGEHLPLDYYDHLVERFARVTTADVDRAARTHLDPSHVVIVIVGDRKRIEAGLRAAKVAPVVVVDERAERRRGGSTD